MRWRDLGFALPFTLALLPWAAVALIDAGVSPGLAAWLPLVVIFVVLPLLDQLLGVDTRNPDAPAAAAEERRVFFRLLTLLALPVWLLTLGYFLARLPLMQPHAGAALAWLLSTGVLGGTLAIVSAHELIHRTSRIERIVGGILLTSVGYWGFKIEHVRGHHVHVATPEDSSTARLGESAWGFIPRAFVRNLREAWRLEAQRLRRRDLPAWSPQNEMLGWTALWLLFLAAVLLALGPGAAIFFVAQGVFAAASLELINYIEHYGLLRGRGVDGRYERVTHLHSWNASQRLSNWLLFNLQRHSDHHAAAGRRYQALRHFEDSPQLPYGYSTMFLIALVPPLWRRIMDPRACAALRPVPS
jgi:alkane 1-monooxygenase